VVGEFRQAPNNKFGQPPTDDNLPIETFGSNKVCEEEKAKTLRKKERFMVLKNKTILRNKN
jgi:hypothetical protein